MTDTSAPFRASLPAEMERIHGELLALAEPLSEEQFWLKPMEPSNSFGHLVLHLTGNIRHFIGAQVAKTGYVRDRDKEFTDPSPPSKSAALAELADAIALYRRTAESLPSASFADVHPEVKMGTLANALVRTLTHVALHRGQMSYIARLAQSS